MKRREEKEKAGKGVEAMKSRERKEQAGDKRPEN